MPWFRNPKPVHGQLAVVLVPDAMIDTVVRLRRDGWAEIPDPNAPPPIEQAEAEAEQQATRKRS